ncbi:MAG TPA: GNAT family N-acetyltransferase [Candidatus Binataceae bacterium]|jgi:GNAT superfamily N-acetyltransferase
MAEELAAAVEDPAPGLDAQGFMRDGFGPHRWFECLIAEIEGEPVGFATICRCFEAHTAKRRLWLGDLYVRAAARRRGAARALMSAVASRALDLDCEAVYWELWRPNTLGRTFYERLGADDADELNVMRLCGSGLSKIAEEGGPHGRAR